MSGRRALLVLGMHRSGTSALTRVMNLCGAALPGDLLPANYANPSGYWEPAAIVAFHDRLLTSLGSTWDDTAELPHAWWTSPAAVSAADELAGIVAAEFGDAPLIVVKDPRACRLVPVWKTALAAAGIEPVAVLMMRHPLEVAASLAQRDDMPAAHALLIWIEHVLAAEADTRTMRRVVVTFDQLLDDWSAVVARMGAALDLRLAARGEGVDAEIAAFLSPSLRHARLDAAALMSPGIPTWIPRAYAWHEQASRGVQGDPAELDAIRRELRDAAVAYGVLLARARDAAATRAADVAAARETLERERQASEAQRQSWDAERTSAAAREARLEADLTARSAAVADLQRVIDRSLDERLRRLFGRGRR